MHPDGQDHVGVTPGIGLVGRFGSAVLVVGPGDDAFTSALVAAVERWPGGGQPPAGLVWTLFGLVGGHRRAEPAWAVAVRVAAGYQLLVHGAATASVRAGGRTTIVTGRDALTWADRIVPDPVEAIALALRADAPVPTAAQSSLRGGLVPGCSGVVITPARPERAAEAGSVAPAGKAGAPLPAPPPAAPSRSDGEETRFVASTKNALVADDGTRTLLDRNYVFGRDPQADPAVGRGAATPIVVRDPDQLVSRVQLYVTVHNGIVTVHDPHSANGTFIAAPGAAEWTRLGREPALLPEGWSLRLGRRVFTHREA